MTNDTTNQSTTATGTANPTSTGLPDLRPALFELLHTTDDLVQGVSPDQLDGPTPCAGFTVRDLLDHLVFVAERIFDVAEGRPAGDTVHAHHADDELAPQFHRTIEQAQQAWAGASLDGMTTTPWGVVMPRAAFVGMYVAELITHGWDLARATGQSVSFDDRAVGASLAAMQEALPAEGREAHPFDPPVDVAADAPLLDRYVAWVGRDPHWRH